MPKSISPFEKYKNSNDPVQREKAANWGIAIGLQAVDGLEVSDYLIELATLNIEGKISHDEVQKHLAEYHTKNPQQRIAPDYVEIPETNIITIFTIGFSGKTRDDFEKILRIGGVRTLIDIRLWRVARFVPWASGKNLTDALGRQCKYMPELAPTKELLTEYKAGTIDWAGYEKIFNKLLADRQVEKLFTADTLNGACFLCAEKTADKCHRRLVAEYLSAHFPDTKIVHL